MLGWLMAAWWTRHVGKKLEQGLDEVLEDLEAMEHAQQACAEYQESQEIHISIEIHRAEDTHKPPRA